MAQIIAYYKYPTQMLGNTIEYLAPQYNIPVYWDCSKTRFDWSNILDTYDSETVIEHTDNETITNKQFMTFTDLKLSDENVIDITSLISINTELLNGDMQLLLCDESGEFIQPIGQRCDITNLKPGFGWGTAHIKHTLSSDTPDGNYRVYLGVKLTGAKEWSAIKQKTRDIPQPEYHEFFLNLSKTGMNYKIDGRTFRCSYNKVQGDAVATLMAACGAATLMNYGTDGNSTTNNNIGKGFIEYMGYDDGLYFVNSNMSSRKEWKEELLEKELQSKRPIYCCGTLEGDGGSHAFVIDGYKYYGNNPYFHVNWGWNGNDNGYFILDAMTTSGGQNYGYAYCVTMGIKPNDELDDGFVFTTGGISATVSDERIILRVDDFMNNSCKTFSGDIIIYATDKHQKEHFLTKSHWNSWEEFTGYGTWNKDIVIPDYIETGEYTIIIKAKEDNSVIEREILTDSSPIIYIERIQTTINSIQAKYEQSKPIIYDLLGRKADFIKKNNIYIKKGKKYIH